MNILVTAQYDHYLIVAIEKRVTFISSTNYVRIVNSYNNYECIIGASNIFLMKSH